MEIDTRSHINDEPISYETFRDVATRRTVTSLNLPFTDGIDHHINRSLSETGLVVLGEIHGIRENADVVYTLVKRYQIETLAMEWKQEAEHAISALILKEQIDPSGIPDAGYGTVTAEYLAVIRQLFDEGILKKIILFDRPINSTDLSASARDNAMAEHILDNVHDSTRMLAVMGNVHAMTESFMLPRGFNHEECTVEPTAMTLRNKLSPLAVITIKYDGGSRFGWQVIDGEHTQGVHILARRVSSEPSEDLVISEGEKISLTLHDVKPGTCM